MGFESKTKHQLERHIHFVAKNHPERIVFSIHSAHDSMMKRKVTRSEVMACLEKGIIDLEPERDIVGGLKCRMERYIAGRHIATVVALDDDDPDMVVVTVIVRKPRR